MDLTPSVLNEWLEWAGARLIAMPGPREGPKPLRAAKWPFEYDQEKFQVLEFRKGLAARMMAPTAKEIPVMDDILSLVNVCSIKDARRVIHYRLLMHPIKNTHLYRWPLVSEKVKINVSGVKRLHREGLQEICKKVQHQPIERIFLFLGSSLSEKNSVTSLQNSINSA